MQWLSDNWFFVLLLLAFVGMHMFGHGGHGGHGGGCGPAHRDSHDGEDDAGEGAPANHSAGSHSRIHIPERPAQHIPGSDGRRDLGPAKPRTHVH